MCGRFPNCVMCVYIDPVCTVSVTEQRHFQGQLTRAKWLALCCGSPHMQLSPIYLTNLARDTGHLILITGKHCSILPSFVKVEQ